MQSSLDHDSTAHQDSLLVSSPSRRTELVLSLATQTMTAMTLRLRGCLLPRNHGQLLSPPLFPNADDMQMVKTLAEPEGFRMLSKSLGR